MTRQDSETHQQQKQVSKDHPFVVKLQHQAGQALALSEARKQELVKRNGYKPGQRHPKCLLVKHRYTQQRQTEQNEINRDAQQVDGLRRVHVSCECCRSRICEQKT
jgi:hypothetical protein